MSGLHTFVFRCDLGTISVKGGYLWNLWAAAQHFAKTLSARLARTCVYIVPICVLSEQNLSSANPETGIGTTRAPNDRAVHQYFHKLRRCHLRAKVGWGANPAIGVDEASLRRGPHGELQWNVDFMDSLEADCYALRTIRQHRQGNVVLWGWLTSGWLRKETLAQWKFDGDVEALAEIAQLYIHTYIHVRVDNSLWTGFHTYGHVPPRAPGI